MPFRVRSKARIRRKTSSSSGAILVSSSSVRMARFFISKSLPGISSGGSTKSTTPASTALLGIPSYAADISSWANVIPPLSFIALSPNVPSDAVPDNTTPMACSRCTSARELKNISMGRLRSVLFLSGRGLSLSTPSLATSILLLGIMYIWFGSTFISSVISDTLIFVTF